MKKITAWICAALVVLLSAAFAGCEKNEKVNTRYEITAEYVPENRTLAGAVKVTFENDTENVLSCLKFLLYPNAYRENALYNPVSSTRKDSAYYNGKNYGEMVISSVNGAKNWEVMGEDENVLCVFLLRPLYPEERVVLDIGFITKVAHVNHLTGVTKKTVNLANFFPILCGIKHGGFVETVYYDKGNPFFLDCADYKLALTLPKEYALVSSGEIVSEHMLESKKVHTVCAINARNFAVALSTDYQTLTQEIKGTKLFYSYYADENAVQTLELIADCFKYYSEMFGKYPYKTYTVAQTGLALPLDAATATGLTLFSDKTEKEEKEHALARAVAKQWWGMSVGSDCIENAWQDEGLSEYAAVTFFENRERYGLKREQMMREILTEYRSFYDVYGSVLGRTDTKMTRHLKDYVSEHEYRCISLLKSTVMFDTLRKSVGDKTFFTALRRYYADNRFKIAYPAHLLSAFEAAGTDTSGFFDSFLTGKGIL